MANQNKVGTHATTINVDNGHITVTYHSTKVFDYDVKNEEVTLDSGEWHTATTKTRINQAMNQFKLPYRVTQKDFGWFIEKLVDGHFVRICDFHDHITLPTN